MEHAEGILVFLVMFPWLLCLAMLAPVYGKLFFSTHKVEYRSIDELAAIQQGLGIGAKRTPEEEATERGGQMASEIMDGVDEDWEGMESFSAALRKSRSRLGLEDDA